MNGGTHSKLPGTPERPAALSEAADPDLHSFVARELEAADVKAAGLCISLAEAAAVRGTDRTAHSLRRLADLGCELGLDRFGRGRRFLPSC